MIADLIIRTAHNFARDDGPHMAAGVAYYAVFSLFPLGVVTITIASYVLDPSTIQMRLLDFIEDQLPGATTSEFVQTNVERLSAARGGLGAAALIGLFWTARAVFGAVHRVVNRAWKVTDQPTFFWNQVFQVLAAAVAIVLLGLSAVFGITGRLLARIDLLAALPWGAALHILPFLLMAPLLILIYKYVPNARVRWRPALAGGIAAAIALEATKQGFAFYLANLSHLDLVYGSIVTVVVVMLFFYLAALILVMGAELASEIGRTSAAGMLDLWGHLRPVRGGLASVQHRSSAASEGDASAKGVAFGRGGG